MNRTIELLATLALIIVLLRSRPDTWLKDVFTYHPAPSLSLPFGIGGKA